MAFAPSVCRRALMRLLVGLVSAAVIVGSSQAFGAVIFSDGLIHVIDLNNSFPFDGVTIQDSILGDPTTLSVVNGGSVGTGVQGLGIEAGGTSQVLVSGGTIGHVVASGPGSVVLNDSATLTFSGGLANNQLLLYDNSNAIVSGGTAWGINVQDDASAIVSGGILGRTSHVGGYLEVYGGEFSGAGGGVFSTIGSGSANIFGGIFHGNVETYGSSNLEISGGSFLRDIMALENSAIQIFGNNFNFPEGELTALSGVLSGNLADGTPLAVDFGRSSGATIILNNVPAVPEPTTLTLFAMGLAGLGFTMRRRRAGHEDNRPL